MVGKLAADGGMQSCQGGAECGARLGVVPVKNLIANIRCKRIESDREVKPVVIRTVIHRVVMRVFLMCVFSPISERYLAGLAFASKAKAVGPGLKRGGILVVDIVVIGRQLAHTVPRLAAVHQPGIVIVLSRINLIAENPVNLPDPGSLQIET